MRAGVRTTTLPLDFPPERIICVSGGNLSVMDEHTIQWNAAADEWLCVRCLRSSDHITREDAAHELSYFDCLSYGSPDPTAVIEERRRTARTKTSLQAEIVLRGRTVPMRVSTTDLSLGGCYVENMFTLNIGAHLTMALWIGRASPPLPNRP